MTGSDEAKAEARKWLISKGRKRWTDPKSNMRISRKTDFASWTVQHPKAARIFGVVLARWRRSGARTTGSDGCWTAWGLEQWSEWTGVPVSTLKRQLDQIEMVGLIERERHHFAGNKVLSFIRPTALALEMTGAKASDWKHLGEEVPVAKGRQPLQRRVEQAFEEAYRKATGKAEVFLSRKDKAALRQIAAASGSRSIQIVRVCVENWGAFQMHIWEAVGATAHGNQPSSVVISMYLQSASDFAEEHEKREHRMKEKVSNRKKPEISADVGSACTTTDEEQKPTLEQVLADLDED